MKLLQQNAQLLASTAAAEVPLELVAGRYRQAFSLQGLAHALSWRQPFL